MVNIEKQVKRLGSSNVLVRVLGARKLFIAANKGDDIIKAMHALGKALKKKENPIVKKYASHALYSAAMPLNGHQDINPALDDLIKALEDENAGVRKNVVWALKYSINDENAEKLCPLLVKKLRDKDTKVREDAAEALRYNATSYKWSTVTHTITAAPFLPAYVGATKDKSSYVRLKIAEILHLIPISSLEDKDAKKLLSASIRLLEDSDTETGEYAATILSSMAKRFDIARAAPKLKQSLGKKFREYSALALIRHYAKKEKWEEATELLTARDRKIRKGAIDGLSNGDADVGPVVPAVRGLLEKRATKETASSVLVRHYITKKNWSDVEGLLKSGDKKIRKTAYLEVLDALRREQCDITPLTPLFTALLSGKDSKGVLSADSKGVLSAAWALGVHYHNKEDWNALDGLLRNSDVRIRLATAVALKSVPVGRRKRLFPLFPAFTEALGSGSIPVKNVVVWLLGEYGAADMTPMMPALSALLEEKIVVGKKCAYADEMVELIKAADSFMYFVYGDLLNAGYAKRGATAALMSTAHYGYDIIQALPNLAKLLKDEDKVVRENAAGAIMNVAYKEGEVAPISSALTEALGDANVNVRRRVSGALWCIAESGRAMDVSSLMKSVEDKDGHVRVNVAMALTFHYFKKEDWGMVTELLNNPDEEIRLGTIGVLNTDSLDDKMGVENGMAQVASQLLARADNRNEREDIRTEAAAALEKAIPSTGLRCKTPGSVLLLKKSESFKPSKEFLKGPNAGGNGKQPKQAFTRASGS